MEIINDKIAAIIEPSLTSMGYALVQVRLMGGNRQTLQIMAERRDDKNMTVEDCAAISHRVSALLDVEDPIASAYTLEVSSPGIDRPLIKLEDFIRFTGYEAKLETKLPVDGRKRFKGRITAVKGEAVEMKTDENISVVLPYPAIHSAKLLLTDELIKKHVQQTETTH